MKALIISSFFAIALSSSVCAQRAADALPEVTLDCYQSFASKTQLPEREDKDVGINSDVFDKPLVRYRLQVVGKTILKIIRDPDRPAFRTEYGKTVWEMKSDFTDKHRIVAWREEKTGGIVRLFTFDFSDLLLSTVDISPAHAIAAGVELHVMKCSSTKS